jgi:putative ABC transport system substrate-binding protein
MKRREFITLLGSTAAWPLAARAQQPTMPAVGFLISATREGYAQSIEQVFKGLHDAGLFENRNVTIDYRYADEQYDRLPVLAAELVQRKVSVIFSTGSVNSALAAKAATSTIPVKYGLVASLNRPGGNVTGVTFYNSALGPKRLELVREMLPKASVVAMLVNPRNPNADPDVRQMQEAGKTVGLRVFAVNATSEQDFDAVFAAIQERRAEALIVNNDTLFQSRHLQLIALAARNAVPAIWTGPRYPRIGALIAYGTNAPELYRQAGVYVGRVVKGEKPADLPVLQPTRFELAINLKTAKALGLDVPPTLVARADEVIE